MIIDEDLEEIVDISVSMPKKDDSMKKKSAI